MSSDTHTSLEAHIRTDHLVAWSELKRWALLGASAMSAHPKPEVALLHALTLSRVSHNALPPPAPLTQPAPPAPEHLGPHPEEVEALESWLIGPSNKWRPNTRVFVVCVYLTSLAEAGRTLPLRFIAPTLTLLSATFELHKGLARCPLSPEVLWLSIGARGRWLLHELSSLRTAETELVSRLALTSPTLSSTLSPALSPALPSRVEGEALSEAHRALEEQLQSLPQKDKSAQDREARATLRCRFESLWLSTRPHELSELISPRLSTLSPLFEQEELRELNALWRGSALITLIKEAAH